MKFSTQMEGEGDDREHDHERYLGEESECQVEVGSELDAAVRLEEPCKEHSESGYDRESAESACGSIKGGAIL